MTEHWHLAQYTGVLNRHAGGIYLSPQHESLEIAKEEILENLRRHSISNECGKGCKVDESITAIEKVQHGAVIATGDIAYSLHACGGDGETSCRAHVDKVITKKVVEATVNLVGIYSMGAGKSIIPPGYGL